MNQQTGKYLIIAGALVTLSGILLYFLHSKLHWLGRLPGDIRVERKNFRFYFPVTTMLLISLLITIIVNIFRRL